MSRFAHLIALSVGPLLLVACPSERGGAQGELEERRRETNNIDCRVLDLFAKPIAGVEVSVTGTGFKAVTDADGRCLLDYAPGVFDVVFSKDGFTRHSQQLSITQKTYLPLADVQLVRIPETKGIYVVMDDGSYVEVPRVVLIDTKPAPRLITEPARYPLMFEGVAKPVFFSTVDNVIFIDTDPGNQKLIRVSEGNAFGELSISNVEAQTRNGRTEGKRTLGVEPANLVQETYAFFGNVVVRKAPKLETSTTYVFFDEQTLGCYAFHCTVRPPDSRPGE